MTIEELTNYDELSDKIDEKFLPHPTLSRCFVLRDQGKIKGFCFTQAILCVEPIEVDEDMKGTMAAALLFEHVCNWLKQQNQTNFYCHTGDEKVRDYLLRMGLKATGMETFLGEL